MGKQYSTYFVSWRDARKPIDMFPNENSYGKAAARALEEKLASLAEDGWIIDRVIAASGMTAKQCAAFTIIAFK